MNLVMASAMAEENTIGVTITD